MSTADSALGQRAQQAIDTRERLIEAAGKLFAERGYAETSVAAIGAAAGASRGIVNFHFGSKEKLLSAVVEKCVREWEGEMMGSAAAQDGLDSIRTLIDAHRRLIAEHPERARLLYRLMFEAMNEPRLARQFSAMYGRWRERTRAGWQQGIDEGLIDPTLDHDAVVASVVGSVRGVALDWLVSPEAFDLDAAYAQLWRSLVRGISP